MNLTQSAFLLSEPAEEFLRALYRQTIITAGAQLNFLAASLRISQQEAAAIAVQLHEIGLVQYEKYGRICLTSAGKSYGKTLLSHGSASAEPHDRHHA